MRNMIKALVLAAGIVGASAAAQAAPVSAPTTLGVSDAPIVHVQMMRHERRMMRHRMMRHEMRHDRRRMMRHRMHRM
jgi:hypothetical protein